MLQYFYQAHMVLITMFHRNSFSVHFQSEIVCLKRTTSIVARVAVVGLPCVFMALSWHGRAGP